MTKVPSPYLLMKRSKRVLDFDESGRPLHPLIDQGLPVVIKQKDMGTLPKWGANYVGYLLLSCKDTVFLVQDDNGIWSLPGKLLKSGEAAESYAKKELGDYKFKQIYSNLDTFDKRTTKHSWIEAVIFKANIDTPSVTIGNGKWTKKNELPKNIHGLHRILIMQNP